ncbi:MAG: SUMF1/EgtB/PvdO family nonheme iron enzyme [Desulfomonilaceae bacterium]|nr:SUMF1/EgtB/PvdO family nonheme iron enzyme [Desulfomonilaceae bacterium]
MPRSYVPVSLFVLTVGLFLCVPGGYPQTDPQGPPSRVSESDREAGPSKIFEAVSGYIEGMRGKPNRRDDAPSSEVKERNRRPIVVDRSESDPRRILEAEKTLARTRLERREWDLAVSSLERALVAASKLSDEKESAELQEKLRIARQKAARVIEGVPQSPGEVRNAIGMKMVVIPAGSFTMGTSRAEQRRVQNVWNIPEDLVNREGPAHSVRINRRFLIGKYQVTAGEFKKFVEDTGYRTVAEVQGWGWVYDKTKKHWVKQSGASWVNPGYEVWEDHPVTVVCEADAKAFCTWLSRKDGRTYSLPTEAQWEYAARGGKDGKRFPWGDEYPDGTKLNIADRRSPVPWADRTVDDGHGGPAPVGSYEPNDFWLYDMTGNVWELCSDRYRANEYAGRASTVSEDPTGPPRGTQVVVRGGNWAFSPAIARNAFRTGVPPDMAADVAGFRVSAEPQPADGLRPERDTEKSMKDLGNASELLAEIKRLVAAGKRLEARRLLERIKPEKTLGKDSGADPAVYTTEVLSAMIDVVEDKSTESFTNTLGMEMIRIPAGAFVMGSSESDIAWAMMTLAQGQPVSLENEYPFHKVRISSPFYMSSTEVTVGQFQKFVEETGYLTDAEDAGGGQVFNTENAQFEIKRGSSWKNPGWDISPDQPVTMVSYYDAQAFAEWLTAKEKLPYKLPTEAQWEYAARGGIPMAQFPWGDDLQDGRRANFADRNSDFEWRDRNADDGYKYVAPVGSYEPNGYGLYDMAGNVLEWVRDYYGEDYYRYTPEIDPEGPGHGENRVTKGGDWTFGPVNLRCAFRGWSRPDLAFYNTGFRLIVETDSSLRPVHFADDFLTKKWVPGPDQRTVAEAVARTKERRPDDSTAKDSKDSTASVRDAPLVPGVKILSFTPKSDGEKAGLRKGDVIIAYHGTRDLTTEKFLALTLETRKQRISPLLVFVRDGHEHVVRANRGFLGIAVMDTTLRGPFKKAAPERDTQPGDKTTKPLDWT